MSELEERPFRLQELIEDYLDGLLDEAGLEELERYLRAEASARRYFITFAQLQTDLHLEARARKAGGRALERIEKLNGVSGKGLVVSGKESAETTHDWLPTTRHRTTHTSALTPHLLIAAGVLVTIAAGWWLALGRVNQYRIEDEPAVAWLVNAQDCTWSGQGPSGNLQAGRILKIERGLAEIHFQCGARVVLEGPSILELISNKSARLAAGKLTARVPAAGVGFEILSPQGKVVDLGTEFGVLSDNSSTEVYVFEGKVEALAAQVSKAEPRTVNLTEHHAARMASGQVTIRRVISEAAASQFVREILPPPLIVPRTLRLTFGQATDRSIRDQAGLGTGLTHRLPGTGELLPASDPNLRLNGAKSQLELTTTNSDLNTQYKLHHGEYLGIRLSDLGFTGKEDFAATVTIPNIPALEVVGQFGLYVGAGSDRSIRGGLIGHKEPGQYTQFLVNNDHGSDTADICKVGLLSTGTDLRLTLKRTAGKYSLTVENLTTGSTSSLTIRHPDFLDVEHNLYIGLFGANTQSEVRRTLIFKDFQATVWTVASGDAKSL